MNINPKQMKFSIRKISMLVAIATLPVSLRAQEIPIYRDASKPIEERIDDALSRMTLEEKVGLLHADRSYGSAGVPRLGIPENNLSDGPSGLRPEMVWQTWIHAGMSSDSCTAFPALVCLAATWNPEMGHLFGKSLGEEALYRDKNMLLGPAVNIFRTPMNGRNFEYMGEDPYLTSKMAVSYIKGVQENHVSACVKHFAVNNQETKRTTINTIVDERTLHEIYFPAFKAAVQEAGVWAVMGAYNKFNGQYCCHNSYLLNARTKQCTKLYLVAVLIFQTISDCTETKERIVFFFQSEIRDIFVTADIQCTDNNFFTLHRLGCCLICFKLLVLCWQTVCSHEQELSTE